MNSINEVSSKDISLSSFKIKNKLHPKFWPNDKLNSRVRLRLMDIADDFIDELSVNWVKPKDIILTGSIANYNWSSYSDVDIHILIDFKKVYPKNSDFVDDYFKAKKENWLRNHEDLKIFGFPIEISVEDSNEDNPSSGRYSLYKNKWIVEPNDFQDAIISQSFVKKQAAKYMSQIDKIEKELETETDLHKCEKCGDKVYKIFDKLKNMRNEGLESEKKEMSSGNIIYKIMRRGGYIDKIWEIYNTSYDKVNSLNDKRKEINEAQRKGERFSAGIIPFRMNKDGKTEVFLGFPGQPHNRNFKPPMWMDRWQILKGHMENGEDPKECAIREFCEESGVSPNAINSKLLVNLGNETMGDGRKLICYGLDLTDDEKFNKTHFRSNMIDQQKFIDLNGGRPYPEIAKYSWKEVGNVGASAPYETSFYHKCDEICQSRYSSEKNNKTVIISDTQKEILKEAMDSSFNLDELYQCYLQDEQDNKGLRWYGGYYGNCIAYCHRHLGEPIGEGSSRMVFQIDDTRVLKLAARKWGQEQNKEEYSMYKNSPYKNLLATIYNDSDTNNFTFIVSEYAIPIEDEDFEHIFGVPFDVIEGYCDAISFRNHEYIKYCLDKYESNKKLSFFLDTLYRLIANGVNPDDLGRLEQWGMVQRNGNPTPVIIDYGFV